MSITLSRALACAKAALAAGAIAAAAGGLAVAIAPSASAVTPSCGTGCIDIFSHDFGTFAHPGFLMDVYKQAQAVGQPLILFQVSNSDPAEDFTIADQGSVSDFYGAGLASAAVDLHYGCGWNSSQAKCTNASPDFEAYEFEYAPFGADTGLCAGVGVTAYAGEKVTLQPCGVSARTLWIADYSDSPFTISIPLINGSDTNFSHPYVLTYPFSSYPTDSPRPGLEVTNLTGFSNGSGPVLGTVNDRQLWAADTGELF